MLLRYQHSVDRIAVVKFEALDSQNRGGLSFIEEVLDFLGQRIVEVVGYNKLPFRRAKLELASFWGYGYELRHRFPRLGNDDFLALATRSSRQERWVLASWILTSMKLV
jgi:hypothetical protein